MARATVYDLDGVAHEMETVDARECCQEMGWSMTPPEPDQETGGITREAMKTFLQVNGVEFAKNISLQKLEALYLETKGQIEAE